MAVIVLLASIALLVVPDILDKDRTTDGASLTRQWLMIAKARAGRDLAPRGLRLVTGLDPQNPAKTNPLWVTECQYTEAPPILVPNPNPSGNPYTPNYDPAVFFTYTLAANGSVTGKTCQIVNLSSDTVAQVSQNCLLQLPVLGTWHRIKGFTQSVQSAPTQYGVGLYTLTVTLDAFPDAPLGAAGSSTGASYVTYHFGLSAAPRPLLGEPLLQLPKNICIDLPSSSPSATGDFDIVFTPSGHVMTATTGQIYLWVRDYTKPGGNPSVYPTAVYDQGGEQQVVALKASSGGLGVFPIAWPPATTPFQFALDGATAP